ncbi:MAG: tetratricopeptide repeat protein [Bryobacteraceae bacterium]|nr:tetratricopeptide repeat protein [Bryobacteraceae bacterium]
MRKAFGIFVLASALGAADAPLERAAALYQKTRYHEALQALANVEAKTAVTFALAGKIHYRKGEFKDSTEWLERAVEAEPGNAHYWNWLGKAYGRRAETSSFLTAPRYASQCRKAFEKAVELAPNNVEALSDLFSYYLDAPGFLGGGVEKAAGIAERIKDLDPPQYHYIQAQLAKKRNDFAAAEQHFRRAAELAPDKAGRLLDLASYLAERGGYEESDALFRKALRTAPDDPEALFARASALIQAKRDLAEARRLLERYLTAELTPDNPPRREAEELLRRAGGG